jgi:hypothetical protein
VAHFISSTSFVFLLQRVFGVCLLVCVLVGVGLQVVVAQDVLKLRVTKSPHLDCDSPFKPNDMEVASFDKAGKAIMNLLALNGCVFVCV